MKTRLDFQNMFESADADFEDAIQRTLRGLKRREGTAVRKKLRVGLVFAVLLCLLLAAAALAAAVRWGVLDFATGLGRGTKVLPEATEMVQSAETIPQEGARLPSADFSLRQAVYDGNRAYVLIEAKAKDSGAILLDSWNDPSSGIANLLLHDENPDATFEEYARARGKTRFLEVNVGTLTEDSWFASGQDVRMEEDGTMLFMLQGACKEKLPEISAEVICYVTPIEKQADGSWRRSEDVNAIEESALTFTLKLSDATLDNVTYTQPLDFPGPGIRVDKVIFNVTPMAVYYEIDYTVTNLAAFQATERGLSFEFLDQNGNRIRRGAAYGEVTRVGDVFGEEAPLVEGGQFIETGSLTAMETLPGTITLRALNGWDKNRYEAHEIKLK